MAAGGRCGIRMKPAVLRVSRARTTVGRLSRCAIEEAEEPARNSAGRIYTGPEERTAQLMSKTEEWAFLRALLDDEMAAKLVCRARSLPH